MRQWQHWNIAFTKCLSKMWDQIPVISKAQVFQFFAQVEIAEYRWRWGILNFIPIKFSHISINTWIICCKTDITLTFGYWVDSFQHQVTCLVNVFLLSTVENSNGIFATDCNNISNQFYQHTPLLQSLIDNWCEFEWTEKSFASVSKSKRFYFT